VSAPTGNGEQRGPESAGDKGTPLPGTRPSRAAANDARHSVPWGGGDPMDQAGFGSENMIHACDYMGTESVRPSDQIAPPPDLAAMGNGGEPFGGS
jgi:hypothetical protein